MFVKWLLKFSFSFEFETVIPAGILRGRLYSLDRPKYLNFGAIGQILGHEMMHGFGEYGSNFLFKGNYFKWWQTNTPVKFQQKIKCLIDQYSNFTIPSLNKTVRTAFSRFILNKQYMINFLPHLVEFN